MIATEELLWRLSSRKLARIGTGRLEYLLAYNESLFANGDFHGSRSLVTQLHWALELAMAELADDGTFVHVTTHPYVPTELSSVLLENRLELSHRERSIPQLVRSVDLCSSPIASFHLFYSARGMEELVLPLVKSKAGLSLKVWSYFWACRIGGTPYLGAVSCGRSWLGSQAEISPRSVFFGEIAPGSVSFEQVHLILKSLGREYLGDAGELLREDLRKVDSRLADLLTLLD